jgi:hypothetical protein
MRCLRAMLLPRATEDTKAMKNIAVTPKTTAVLEEIEQQETLKRHGAAQPPILSATMNCPKCKGWPLIVMAHDNTDPAALHVACAKCNTQYRLVPDKAQGQAAAP